MSSTSKRTLRRPGLPPKANTSGEALDKDLSAAMQRLTALERQIFLLKHIEGWRLDEIAESLQSNINNVKSALFRAVRKLRVGSARVARRIMISDDDLLLYYYRDGLDAAERARIGKALANNPSSPSGCMRSCRDSMRPRRCPKFPCPNSRSGAGKSRWSVRRARTSASTRAHASAARRWDARWPRDGCCRCCRGGRAVSVHPKTARPTR